MRGKKFCSGLNAEVRAGTFKKITEPKIYHEVTKSRRKSKKRISRINRKKQECSFFIPGLHSSFVPSRLRGRIPIELFKRFYPDTDKPEPKIATKSLRHEENPKNGSAA
jgi:hypothetical protein